MQGNNNLLSGLSSRLIYRMAVLLLLVLNQGRSVAMLLPDGSDSLAQIDSVVSKSIYPPTLKNKSNLYNFLWGTHYRHLYIMPITTQAVTLNTLSGGMQVIGKVPDFHALLLKNKQEQLYMLKPLGGSTSFIESKFFQEIYNPNEFKNTYLDEFIGDAYTIINPYTFISADYMARQSGLSSSNSHIYYIPPYSTQDTVTDGVAFQGKLVSIIDLPDLNTKKNILTTEKLLQHIQENKLYMANQYPYIRERLFDMLVGDWNKIPENWNWLSVAEGDSLLYNPMVIDRNHSFTKVDGILFKQMLKALTLSFITDYNGEFKDLKKINKLGFALDMALISRSDETVWLEEARFLKKSVTDQLIEDAFRQLPAGIDTIETGHLKQKLKLRRDKLEEAAHLYYTLLQRNPVLTGTNHDDSFVIDRYGTDSLRIRIYNPKSQELVFDRKYGKNTTKEIWLYGLEGNDRFEVNGQSEKEIPLYLISGDGDNEYAIEQKSHVRVYGAKSHADRNYDYQKIKYHDFSFSPWGVYDSDNGFSLGAYFTYTMYGFKRAPFTYRHRIGYNYREGFMYQAVFPGYDGKKSFNMDASISSPRSFTNFFGFGNTTDGYKDESKNFNRVRVRKYTLTPSFHLNVSEDKSLVLYSSLEMFKAKRPDDRFINQIYPDDHQIFNANYFVDLGGTFQVQKRISSLIQNLEGSLSAGWTMNIKDPGRNFPYTELEMSMDMKFTDRLTWATMANAKVIYNNKYEFYQAATTEMRGFRDNRFIGKQSFYQCSDFRVDMGKIANPFTPLKYGLFAGFDYGRVWIPNEQSRNWHTSYGGGVWLTLFNKFTTKYSWFGSTDSFRFMFELGLGF